MLLQTLCFCFFFGCVTRDKETPKALFHIYFYLYNLVKLSSKQDLIILFHGIQPLVTLSHILLSNKSKVRPNVRSMLMKACILNVAFYLASNWIPFCCDLVPGDFSMMGFSYFIPLMVDWKRGMKFIIVGPLFNMVIENINLDIWNHYIFVIECIATMLSITM